MISTLWTGTWLHTGNIISSEKKWSERNTCAWRISHDDIWHWVYRSILKYKRWASVGRIFMTNVLFWFSGLVMLQTTNDVFNTSLLKFVSSNSLLAWHRVRLANLMAHSGKEWSDVYKQYNSGRSRSVCCLVAVVQCCESICYTLRVSQWIQSCDLGWPISCRKMTDLVVYIANDSVFQELTTISTCCWIWRRWNWRKPYRMGLCG